MENVLLPLDGGVVWQYFFFYTKLSCLKDRHLRIGVYIKTRKIRCALKLYNL